MLNSFSILTKQCISFCPFPFIKYLFHIFNFIINVKQPDIKDLSCPNGAIVFNKTDMKKECKT